MIAHFRWYACATNRAPLILCSSRFWWPARSWHVSIVIFVWFYPVRFLYREKKKHNQWISTNSIHAVQTKSIWIHLNALRIYRINWCRSHRPILWWPPTVLQAHRARRQAMCQGPHSTHANHFCRDFYTAIRASASNHGVSATLDSNQYLSNVLENHNKKSFIRIRTCTMHIIRIENGDRTPNKLIYGYYYAYIGTHKFNILLLLYTWYVCVYCAKDSEKSIYDASSLLKLTWKYIFVYTYMKHPAVVRK